MVSQSQLDIRTAAIVTVIAALMNTISKVTLVFLTGSSELFWTFIGSFAVIFLICLFSSLLVFWLGVPR